MWGYFTSSKETIVVTVNPGSSSILYKGEKRQMRATVHFPIILCLSISEGTHSNKDRRILDEYYILGIIEQHP